MSIKPTAEMRLPVFTLSVLAFVTGATAQAAVDYLREIKPLLKAQCVKCHGARTQKGDLRLDTAAAALSGGENGPSIVPGKSSESLLMQTIEGTHVDMPKMPFKRPPLEANDIALIRRWIDEGAKAPSKEEPSDDRHWAFIAPVKQPAPQVRSGDIPVADSAGDRSVAPPNPIDAFICARLAKAGLPPSPEAERTTLIRRVHLDLLGLPPALEEVERFLSDTDSAAYERVVDQTLKSPHYGERWGRWWLDQARYADSNGYSIDSPRQIWRYRDWVIDALNRDMPFDQFTMEQIAGDLLPNPKPEQIIATGFHRNTQINHEGGIDPEQFRVESVVDRVGTTGTVWLGLTINCCQCHDHKFDPLTQKEFYQMFAFFNHTEPDGHGGGTGPMIAVPDARVDYQALEQEKKRLEKEVREALARNATALAEWEQELSAERKEKLAADVKKALAVPAAKRSLPQQRLILFASEVNNDQEFKFAHSRLLEIEKGIAARPMTMVMKEMARHRETRLFIKGDFTRPDAVVTESVPAALHPLKPAAGAARLNRLDLARWLVSRDNPLTARVIVNRIWQQYFGRGIVETENDFGAMGSPPTHPELLDWLAVEFMEKGWSLKHLHKLIVMSQTYRQSSNVRGRMRKLESEAGSGNIPNSTFRDPQSIDPNNYLFWRQTRLRLDAEAVRDVCLAASGLLSPKMGGPGVYPPIPDGVMSLGQVKRPWPVSAGADRYRRGIYTFVFRATPPPSLSVFDAPEGLSSCTRRIRSNTPLQALTLLNDSAYFEFAEAMTRIVEEDGVDAAFQRCTSRKPTSEERERLSALDSLAVARVLLNLDETITRE